MKLIWYKFYINVVFRFLNSLIYFFVLIIQFSKIEGNRYFNYVSKYL